jgi:hypothetical protein
MRIRLISESVFGSVVMIVFQSIFYSEMYQNNIFYFLKIIFDISALKWSKNTKKILIWSKEKNQKFLKFFKNAFEIQKQIRPKSSC